MRELFWLMDNGEGGGAPAQAAPAASGGAPAAPETPAPAPAAPQPQEQWTDFREALKPLGVDLSGFQDQGAALAHLAAQVRQAQQILPQWQQVVPHWTKYQEWLKDQQKPKQEKGWWNPPEYDPSWEAVIARDGANAPYDVVQRYQAARQHMGNFIQKFAMDPIGSIKPGIEEVVRQVAQELIKEQLGGFRQSNEAQSFIRDNSDWLLQKDQNGQFVLGFDGKPTISPLGQAFYQQLNRAAELGITNQQAQQEYALARLQAMAAQTKTAPDGEAQKQQFLANAGNPPAAPPAGTPPSAQVPPQKLPLRERMMRNFAGQGMNLHDKVA